MTSSQPPIPLRSQFVDKDLIVKYESGQDEKRLYFLPGDVYAGKIMKWGADACMKTVYYLFSILPSGTKTCVILDNIPIYFDVLVDDGDNSDKQNKYAETLDTLRQLIRQKAKKGDIPYRIEKIHAFKLHGFQTEKSTWARFHFDNLWNRKMALDAISSVKTTRKHEYQQIINKRADVVDLEDRTTYDTEWREKEMTVNKYQTANDENDPGYFYKICRDFGFNGAGWNIVDCAERINLMATFRDDDGNLRHIEQSNLSGTTTVPVIIQKRAVKSGESIMLSGGWRTENLRGIDHCYIVDVRAVVKMPERDINREEWAKKARRLIMTWDIETFTYGPATGEAPKAEDDNFVIFMICATFHWFNNNSPLCKICLVDNACFTSEQIARLETERLGSDASQYLNPEFKENFTLISCGNEKALVSRFAELVGSMSPDIIVAFNNSNFDTPIYVSRVIKYTNGDKAIQPFIDATTNTYTEKYEAVKADENFAEYIYSTMSNIVLYKPTKDAVIRELKTRERIKIGPDEYRDIYRFNFKGCLDTDAMVVFNKLNPNKEVGRGGKSLNDYLKMNKLDSKEDLPYKQMFAIYRESVMLSCVKIPKENINADAYPKDSLEHRKLRNLEDMFLVAKYCVVDAWRCQQLYVKKSIVDDKAELANLSYMQLFAAFYRADGVKVRNLLARGCNERGILFTSRGVSEEDVEKDKYPGAFVLPPTVGLNKERPMVGLDYASLYPSLMMTYNFSPDKTLTGRNARAMAEKLRALGYEIHHVIFECIDGSNKQPNGRVEEGYVVGHSGIIDRRDERVLSGYMGVDGEPVQFLPDTVNSVLNTVADLNKIPKLEHKKGRVECRGRPRLPGEEIGVSPKILEWLKRRRGYYKTRFVKLKEIEEALKAGATPATETLIFVGMADTENEYAKLGINKSYADYIADVIKGIDHDDLEFQINNIESKQKAMKVHMNTFYGETGAAISSIYQIIVAGGITTYGQKNLRKIKHYVELRDYKVWYGDTDSLYISSPTYLFEKIDKNSMSQEDYCKKLVQITRTDINTLRQDVGDYLALTTHYNFLEMAYEEVLFPFWLLGKKKYAGYAHEKTENFHPSRDMIFKKGVDMIKQGQTDLAKEAGWKVLETCLDIFNNDAPETIVKRVIFEIVNKKHDLSVFKLKAKYKPMKKNIRVNGFVERMKVRRAEIERQIKLISSSASDNTETEPQIAKLTTLLSKYEMPEPGDRIEYVIVKRNDLFDARGRKVADSKAEQMEFYSVVEHLTNSEIPAEREHFKIDMMHYLDSAILGMMARYLSFMPQFQPTPEFIKRIQFDDKFDTKCDAHVIGKAREYLEDYTNGLLGYSKTRITEDGLKFKRVFSAISKQAKEVINSRFQNGELLSTMLFGKRKTKANTENKEIDDDADADADNADNADDGDPVKIAKNEALESAKKTSAGFGDAFLNMYVKKHGKINFASINKLQKIYSINSFRFVKKKKNSYIESRIKLLEDSENKILNYMKEIASLVRQTIGETNTIFEEFIRNKRTQDGEIEIDVSPIFDEMSDADMFIIEEWQNAFADLKGVYIARESLIDVIRIVKARKSSILGCVELIKKIIID